MNVFQELDIDLHCGYGSPAHAIEREHSTMVTDQAPDRNLRVRGLHSSEHTAIYDAIFND